MSDQSNHPLDPTAPVAPVESAEPVDAPRSAASTESPESPEAPEAPEASEAPVTPPPPPSAGFDLAATDPADPASEPTTGAGPTAYPGSGGDHMTPPPAYTPPPAQPYGAAGPAQPMAAQPMSQESEKQIGALAHAIGAGAYVLSAGTLGFVAALIMYIMYKDRGPFVRAHVTNALNVQITTGIVSVVAYLLIFTLIGALVGIPLLLAAGVYCVVVHVLGAVKAMNGEWWKPPFTIELVK